MPWMDALAQVRDLVMAEFDPDARFVLAAPAAEARIGEVEAQIGRPIPASLREVFSRDTGDLDVSWWCEDEDLPAEFQGTVGGMLRISLDGLPSVLDEWPVWEDGFSDTVALGMASPPHDFHALFPFSISMGGDCLAMILEGPEAGAVYFLDHEDISMARLGVTIADFLHLWTELGCLEPETMAGTFYDAEANRVRLDTPLARAWRSRLGPA